MGSRAATTVVIAFLEHDDVAGQVVAHVEPGSAEVGCGDELLPHRHKQVPSTRFVADPDRCGISERMLKPWTLSDIRARMTT